MIRTGMAIAALSVALVGCAGVAGPTGNDTGGIIPWSIENERWAPKIAQENCGYYNKYAIPTSIHRVPGDFISYRCAWEPPGRHRYR